MSSSVLRAAWEAAQQPTSDPGNGAALRAAWEAAQTGPTVPKVAPDATSALARNRENPTGDAGPLLRGAAANALNAVQVFPGAEAFEAKAGQLGSKLTKTPLSYEESLGALRKNTEAIPAPLRVAEKGLAAIPALSLLPEALAKSGMATGATISGAGRLLKADLEAPEDRLKGALVATGKGAVLGKALDVGGTLARSVFGKTGGELATTAKAERGDADAINYGKAEAEGASAPSSPTLANALDSHGIKPYVDKLRQSETYANADEPTLAREAYKLMSKQQTGYVKMLDKEYDADIDLKNQDLTLQKQRLMDVAKQVMPSFERAVQEHGALMGEKAAGAAGSQLAKRLASKSRGQVSGQLEETQSPEALTEAIPSMRPNEAGVMRDRMLGRLKTTPGVLPTLKGANRIAPFVNRLDQQSGNTLPTLLKQLGLVGATQP